jgi:allantoinase
MNPDLVIRGRRVVAAGGIGPASVHVRDGRIAAVAGYDEVPTGARIHDASGLVVMPGLVDTHVHVNEPGRTEWEGFETATRAAAAGGVTTLVDMPLNSVPATTTVEALEIKRSAARGRIAVDVGFWGGIVPGNQAHLKPLCAAGVLGFKCFLVHSGVDEFPAASERELMDALPITAACDVPVLAHAELPAPIDRAVSTIAGQPPSRYATWLASRPPAAEVEAVDLLIRLSQRFAAPIHIVHVSAADVLPLLRAARQAGVRVTAETCPHYLTFAAEDIHDGATSFKCAPPIRSAANGEALWRALLAGDLDLIATDHSPCPPSMKCAATGDFLKAWGGIASLELSLPVVWTGLSARGGDIARLVQWMCEGPARLAGLSNRKGCIAAGRDADIILWDPDAHLIVRPELLHQRHKATPYADRTLRGVVRATFLRGELVCEDGVVREARGTLLTRDRAARI